MTTEEKITSSELKTQGLREAHGAQRDLHRDLGCAA